MFELFELWNDLTFILLALGFLLFGALILFIAYHDRFKCKPYKVRVVEVLAHRQLRDSSTDLARDDKGTSKNGGRFFFVFMGLFASIFLGVGLYQGYTYWDLKQNGVKAEAIVVDNKRSVDSEGSVSYKAVVRFLDQNGNVQRLTDTISYGSTPSYKVDTRLVVFYDPNKPKRFVIDDFWHHMTLSFIFVAIGLFVVLICVFLGYRSFGNADVLGHGADQGSKKLDYKPYVFSAVVEYQDDRGERVVEPTAWSSHSVLDMMPGRRKTLYKSSDAKDSLRPKNLVLFIIGLIIFCPGLFFAYTVFKDGLNILTILVLLGAIGFFSFKIWRFLSKIPQDEWDKGWADFRKNGVSVTSKKLLDRSDDKHTLTAQQVRAFAIQHLKTARFLMVLFGAVGIGLGYGAYYKAQDTRHFLENSMQVEGEVVNLNSRRSSDSYTYYAEVEFRDNLGERIRFSDSVGSSSPMYKRGDRVTVLYDPENVYDAIIDRGIFNWLFTMILAGCSFLSFLIAWSRWKLIGRVRVSGHSGRV